MPESSPCSAPCPPRSTRPTKRSSSRRRPGARSTRNGSSRSTGTAPSGRPASARGSSPGTRSYSAALSEGANLKWVARYCGTSVEMIDEHYGKWLGDDGGQLAILATGRTGDEYPQLRAVSGARGATFGETFRGAPENAAQARRRGGDSN